MGGERWEGKRWEGRGGRGEVGGEEWGGERWEEGEVGGRERHLSVKAF